MSRPRIVTASIVLATVATLAGCNSDGGSSGDGQSFDVATDALAFRVETPGGSVARGHVDQVDESGCRRISYGFRGMRIAALADDCRVENRQIGNGQMGDYRTIADVPDAADPEGVDTALGPATIVGQEYFECTNSCDEWDLDIAVIELDEPVDADFPTLVVMMIDEDLDRDDLVAVLDTLEP